MRQVMPLTYLLSLFFHEHTMFQTILQILYQTVGFLLLIFMLVVEVFIGTSAAWVGWLRCLFYILPNFDLTYSLVCPCCCCQHVV